MEARVVEGSVKGVAEEVAAVLFGEAADRYLARIESMSAIQRAYVLRLPGEATVPLARKTPRGMDDGLRRCLQAGLRALAEEARQGGPRMVRRSGGVIQSRHPPAKLGPLTGPAATKVAPATRAPVVLSGAPFNRGR